MNAPIAVEKIIIAMLLINMALVLKFLLMEVPPTFYNIYFYKDFSFMYEMRIYMQLLYNSFVRNIFILRKVILRL
ncbi:hypothetical protein SDC9_158852 [bioreactor metagenome]|uniref:Uncharacterized protein n=1 Tax=bioreactor metagenome TaxID=1076179 RepID=A0A645FDX0_9ZZZZ